MTPTKRQFEAMLRQHPEAFLDKVFRTLNPGQHYVQTLASNAILHQLERVRKGDVRRLIINMPPRSLKSAITTVTFPAFVLGHDPKKRIICISYSGELAKKHANDFRAILSSPWYWRLFPDTRIGAKDSESEIELTRRGFRYNTSVGGTLTGRGSDIIIIDDPLKPEDAQSEAKRTSVNQWFANTVASRLDDKRKGAIIIVMQRLHVDDLVGHLLKQGDSEWEVLNLPAIAEQDQDIPLLDGSVHHRKVGDLLSPEREPIEVMNSLKAQLGSATFAAQYQQAPEVPGGAMILRKWIVRYDALPDRSKVLYRFQSWDTASKGGPNNDWSVCTTWDVGRDGTVYLVDVWRDKVDYPDLKRAVQTLARTYGAHQVLIEDTAAGIALIQELKRSTRGLLAIKPILDKQMRMSIASAKFANGVVRLPRNAPWLPDFESELFAFPYGRHDDQCDSVSQALNFLDSNRRPLIITDKMVEESKIPWDRAASRGFSIF